MTESEKLTWNNAIEEACKRINQAPIFTRKDLGPAVDADKLIILDICERQVRKLLK